MKYIFSSLALVAGASAAAIIPRSCTFSLTASGGQSGSIGQLGDGQNRIGGDLPPASYSISNGKITDANGRGCILTPPTTQLQCDEGAAPTGGFSIGSNGQLLYNGSPTFYACPASDSEWNLYTTPVENQSKCVKIELTASGCSSSASSSESTPTPSGSAPAGSSVATSATQQPSYSAPVPSGSAPAGSSAATSTQQPTSAAPAPSGNATATAPSEATTPAPAPTSAAPAPSGTGESCPADLGGEYQYPHLIVPVSQQSPDKAYGTSYNGTLTSDISSIFNFDIPKSYTGTCSLVFLFPEQSQLETSSFSFSGDGVVDFKQLDTIASSKTTYSSVGGVKTDFGGKTIHPGSSTVVSTFSCPAGETVSYELSSVSGTSLNYFQDWNPSPIGLFITTC